jgi:hypothetical protein
VVHAPSAYTPPRTACSRYYLYRILFVCCSTKYVSIYIYIYIYPLMAVRVNDFLFWSFLLNFDSFGGTEMVDGFYLTLNLIFIGGT